MDAFHQRVHYSYIPKSPAPLWTTDHCTSCKQHLDNVLSIKVNCKYCGKVFCDKCTKQKLSLPKFGFDTPVPVCTNCCLIVSKQLNE